jgi:hypothetical protein
MHGEIGEDRLQQLFHHVRQLCIVRVTIVGGESKIEGI